MSNDLELKAMCIHGIQSTVEDWVDIEHELAHSLEIEHAPRQFFSEKNVDFQLWEDTVVQHESELIRKGAHNILIAHSYGTHRAGRILQECPDLYGAILINPPQNKMTSKQKHIHREYAPDDSFMNALFHEITFDMSDDGYRLFVERHRNAYTMESKEIGRQAAYLKKGKPFIDRVSEIPQSKVILVIRASGDPWDVGELSLMPNMTTEDLGPHYGHYPHCSKPQDVSRIIRTWLHEKIFSDTEAGRNFLEEPIAYA
jgi:hypothetical protein